MVIALAPCSVIVLAGADICASTTVVVPLPVMLKADMLLAMLLCTFSLSSPSSKSVIYPDQTQLRNRRSNPYRSASKRIVAGAPIEKIYAIKTLIESFPV